MTLTEDQVRSELEHLPPPSNLPALPESGKTSSTPPEKPAVVTRKRAPSGGIASIVNAIAQITSEVGVIHKKGHNKFHNYKYAAMQDVLQQLTPIMGKHGVVIFQSEIGRTFVFDQSAVAVEYEFTAAHISGETWTPQRKTGLCRCRDSKGGFDDKAFNKCSTAARKYYLLELFQVATDEEEADAHDTLPPQKPYQIMDTPQRAPSRPAPAATQRADTEGRLGDGTRYDASSGEIIPDHSLRSAGTVSDSGKGDEKGKAGAAAPAPAEPNPVEVAAAQLAEAAKRGMTILETAWYALPEDLRKQLKGELPKYKKIASQVP